MFSDEYYSGADYANLNPIFMFSDEYYSGADYATPEDSYAQPYSNGTEGFRWNVFFFILNPKSLIENYLL